MAPQPLSLLPLSLAGLIAALRNHPTLPDGAGIVLDQAAAVLNRLQLSPNWPFNPRVYPPFIFFLLDCAYPNTSVG